MDKVKVTFMLEKELKVSLKVYAAKEGTSVSETIKKAIQEYMQNHPVK